MGNNEVSSFPVRPSPPMNPEAIDWTKESVSLSWQPPKDTGRGKILGYLVEFQMAGDEEWLKVGSVIYTKKLNQLNQCDYSLLKTVMDH